VIPPPGITMQLCPSSAQYLNISPVRENIGILLRFCEPNCQEVACSDSNRTFLYLAPLDDIGDVGGPGNGGLRAPAGENPAEAELGHLTSRRLQVARQVDRAVEGEACSFSNIKI